MSTRNILFSIFSADISSLNDSSSQLIGKWKAWQTSRVAFASRRSLARWNVLENMEFLVYILVCRLTRNQASLVIWKWKFSPHFYRCAVSCIHRGYRNVPPHHCIYVVTYACSATSPCMAPFSGIAEINIFVNFWANQLFVIVNI